MTIPFTKYHGLGNDYLVIEPPHLPNPSIELVTRICHRNYGPGSDGILLGPLKSEKGDFGLRIFNPDGSEAEKSGNGLRIFARYLADTKRVGMEPFTVSTLGGTVRCQVFRPHDISVEMGRVSFSAPSIPMTGPDREVIREKIEADGEAFEFCGATIGNPHCVILVDSTSPEIAKRFGPILERSPLFPNRTNVHFVQPISRSRIRVEFWERGAGYTLASGSGSSASAAVCRRLGLCDSEITVETEGGELLLTVSERFEVVLRGPVVKVCDGTLAQEGIAAV